jgi:hypothetical protein
MTTDTTDDAVPAEAVRELIAEWREIDANNEFDEAIKRKRNRQRLKCADELEALLADVEGERDE